MILTLPIAAIAIPVQRIGYFNTKHAERLGQDMARNGQHDPIHVQSNSSDAWTLIAGLHRLRGLQNAGINQVLAIEVADNSASPDDLARLELSENLDHQHRRPIERAILMAARARLEEAQDHPGHVGEKRQSRAGRARQSANVIMTVADWRQRTADALDCSLSTLDRYERIHRNIVVGLPDLHERINFHPLCASFAAVNAIASRNDVARRLIAEKLLESDDWQSMDAVMDKAGVKTSTGVRATSKMKNEWDKATPEQRIDHVGFIGDAMTPIEARHMVSRLRKRGLVDIHQR